MHIPTNESWSHSKNWTSPIYFTGQNRPPKKVDANRHFPVSWVSHSGACCDFTAVYKCYELTFLDYIEFTIKIKNFAAQYNMCTSFKMLLSHLSADLMSYYGDYTLWTFSLNLNFYDFPTITKLQMTNSNSNCPTLTPKVTSGKKLSQCRDCLLYTSPSPRD